MTSLGAGRDLLCVSRESPASSLRAAVQVLGLLVDGDRTMTCKDAISAHVNWKLRIHTLISGKLDEKLDPATIARDNVCELGKWLYADGKKEIPAAQHGELQATHADFHREAARIVGEFYTGHKIGLEAIEMDSSFGKLTTRIVGILSKMAKTQAS